jgi:hypothetical protein
MAFQRWICKTHAMSNPSVYRWKQHSGHTSTQNSNTHTPKSRSVSVNGVLLCTFFTTYSTLLPLTQDYRASNYRMINDWIREYVEGSGRGLLEVLPRHFLGGTEEYEKPLYRNNQVSVLKYEPEISRIWGRNATSGTKVREGIPVTRSGGP